MSDFDTVILIYLELWNYNWTFNLLSDVLDEIWDVIESVSEGFLTGTTIYQNYQNYQEIPAQVLMFYVAVAFIGKGLMSGRTDAHTDD